jgi:hypothetical protein
MKKIGFDVHGVLNPYDNQLESMLDSDWFIKGLKGARSFFVSFMQEALKDIRSKDIEVWIISGPPSDEVLAELNDLGYVQGTHYDYLETVVDYLKLKNVKMWKDEKQTWWASDEDWWSAKAAMCGIYKIDVMVDDKERYQPYFEKLQVDCKFHLWKWGQNGDGRMPRLNLW